MPIAPDTLVDDVMRQWPATIRTFLDFQMHCVGCPIACFHTVDDACREHHVDMERFLQALEERAPSALQRDASAPATLDFSSAPTARIGPIIPQDPRQA